MTVFGVSSHRGTNPYLIDAALAGSVAGFAVLFDLFGPDIRSNAALVWDIALAAPLALRRTSQIGCAAAVACLCLAQWFADVRAVGDVALLVALYALASREQRRWALPAAVAVAEVGVVMVVLRWQTGHKAITLLLLTGTVTASWVLGLYTRTRRAYIASVLERALTAERERDSSNRIAVADERVRIAREMHDVIAHGLSVMISLNDGAAALATSPQVHQAISQSADVGRQALEEMRLMLGVLRGPAAAQLVPQPGIAQLPDLLTTARAAGLTARLGVTGELAGVPATAQLTVYRIVQESLTNVLKHARNVSRVSVEVAREPDRLTVVVANDGDAVQPHVKGETGHGLTGMRERVALYAGELRAAPAPGGGWVVEVRLPLTERAGT